MAEKILFIPSAPGALSSSRQDILELCQKLDPIKFNFYFLCDKPEPGSSIYAGTLHEFTEPIKELAPCLIERWGPVDFQRQLKKEKFSHCIFWEPEILAQKLIPISSINNVKTIIFEKRSFFQACPISEKYASLFRGSSYALADFLITPDAITAASWLCAGFPNSVTAPEENTDWEKLLHGMWALPQGISSYHGLRVFEEAFSALEKQQPIVHEDRVQIIDSRKAWQKKLEEVVDKVLPCGSLRRKAVKFGCKTVWKTIKFFRIVTSK